jgi:hypothetical protein
MDLAKMCEDILTIPYLSLAEQLDYSDTNAEEALRRCEFAMAAHRESILVLARRRLVDGFPEYRDHSWRKDDDALLVEELEEYADAVNYRLMRMRREEQS